MLAALIFTIFVILISTVLLKVALGLFQLVGPWLLLPVRNLVMEEDGGPLSRGEDNLETRQITLRDFGRITRTVLEM